MAKMKKILENIALDSDAKPVNKFKVIETVSGYGELGESIYGKQNIMDVANQLSEIADSAHNHIMSETDDWFDKVSINRNMKNMTGMVKEFKKSAMESHQLNQRLSALYEDIGVVLNRYYDIKEGLDPVGDEDRDINNDGDMDSEDKYLRNKRKKIDQELDKKGRVPAGKMVPHEGSRVMSREGTEKSNESKISGRGAIGLKELVPIFLAKNR